MLGDIHKAVRRQFVAEVQPVIWGLMAGSKQQGEPCKPLPSPALESTSVAWCGHPCPANT